MKRISRKPVVDLLNGSCELKTTHQLADTKRDVSDSQRESVQEVLYGLKVIERTLVEGKHQEAKMLINFVESVHRKCRKEFRSSR